MEERKAATSAALQKTMAGVADALAARFPHHATALRGELFGTRLTTDRWNRMSMILSSLMAVPGVHLTQPEHIARNLGLEAANVAKEMALALLGTRNVEYRLDFVSSWAEELRDRMRTEHGKQRSAEDAANGDGEKEG